MSARGSVTPTGKQQPGQRSFDYPLTPTQAAQAAAGTLSTPIHIAPRASPRGTSGSVSSVAAANAAMNMAQSCPTFSWQPPAAPSARPRIASIDPPPMELPPSPPVFSPMQAEAIKTRKDEAGPLALKKQIYSRSLSNYSSSAPTHVDYLSKFQPNLGQLDEAGAAGDSDEEEEEEAASGYRPSARASGQHARRDDDESPTLGAPAGSGGIGIGIGKGRVSAISRQDDFSLSKSPTIFSIMSTSAQAGAHPGLHTADTSTSSTASGSPGHSILGSIAAGENPNRRRSLIGNKPSGLGSSSSTAAAAAAAAKAQADAEDDLQFSISLTDEQDEEGGDNGSKQQDFLPLY